MNNVKYNTIKIALLCMIFVATAANAQLVSYLAFNGCYQPDPNGPELFADFAGDAGGSFVNGATYVRNDLGTSDLGYAAIFDDVDDYGLVSCPPPASMNFARNDFTVSGWINVSSVAGEEFYHMVLENGVHNGGGVNIWIGPDNKSFRGKIGFEVKGDGADNITVLSDARVDDDQWHWFAGVSQNQTIKLYVDGVLQIATANYGAMTTATPPISHTTVIGNKLGGQIEELRVYDESLDGVATGGVLTSGKLYELWQMSSGDIKGQWKFNEAKGDVLAADTVDEIAADLQNGASIVAGEAGIIPGGMGNACRFDSVDDAAKWSDSNPNSLFLGVDDFTITGWFKIDDVLASVEEYYHLLLGASIHGQSGVDVWVGPSNKSWRGKLAIAVKGTDSADNIQVMSNLRVDDSQWHWFAGVSQSGTLTLYIDGIKQDATAIYGPTTSAVPPLNFASSIGNVFSGDIDELTIYSVALTGDLSGNELTGGQLYDSWQLTTSMTTCDQQQNAGISLIADLDHDCSVNFADFAAMADNWLKCYGLDSQDCVNPFVQ